MRIGRTIIDTDNMTTDELSTLINALREIRKRKVQAEELLDRMKSLLTEAKEEGFTFIDKDFGQVWAETDFSLYDERS
jgi:hypothetical protein